MPARAPSRVSSTGTRYTAPLSTPLIRFTQADLAAPATLHRILTQIVRAHEESSRPARASSRLRGTTFEGLAFTAATAYTIQHGFGVAVHYDIVDWQGAAGIPKPRWTTNDGTNLVIVPDVTGVAALEVWPV